MECKFLFDSVPIEAQNVQIINTWDVKPPFELIPKWDPPPPFQKKGLSILPEWGLKFGKWISRGLLMVASIALILLLLPNFLNRIFNP